MKKLLFIFLLASFFVSCNGPTLPLVKVTVQIQDFSPEEVAQLDDWMSYKNITNGGFESYKYFVNGYVTFNWKVTEKWKNRAILSDLMMTNYWYMINAEPDPGWSFEGWQVEAGKEDYVEFRNVGTNNMNISFKQGIPGGSVKLTAKLQRKKLLIPYYVGNGYIIPTGITDSNINSIYKSLLQMEKRAIDLKAIYYPTYDIQNRIIKSSADSTYFDFLTYLKSLDKTKDGLINYFEDKITVAELDSLLIGKLNPEKTFYVGWNAGALFFGDRVNQIAPGKGVSFEMTKYGSSFYQFDFDGWQTSSSVTMSDATSLVSTALLDVDSEGGVAVGIVKIKNCTISLAPTENGSVVLDPLTTTIDEGDSFNFTVTADAGFTFDRIENGLGRVIHSTVDDVDPNKYTSIFTVTDYEAEEEKVFKVFFKAL